MSFCLQKKVQLFPNSSGEDPLLWCRLSTHEWNLLPDHEADHSGSHNECTCSRSNCELKCFFRRLADQPAAPVTAEEEEKIHYRNCKQVAKEFQLLNTTLEALGGSSYLVACIPHPKIPDLDQSTGAAGLAVATTLDGYGINLRTLLASEQTLVNLDKDSSMAATMMSRAASGDSKETTAQQHISTGSGKRSELQGKVRDRLRELLADAGRKSGMNGQLPHGIWKDFNVVNWPMDIPAVQKLNLLSAAHCEKVIQVLDTLY